MASITCIGKTPRATDSKQPETGGWNFKCLLFVTEKCKSITGDPQQPTIMSLVTYSYHDEFRKAVGQQISLPGFSCEIWLVKMGKYFLQVVAETLTILVAFQELTKRVVLNLEAHNR